MSTLNHQILLVSRPQGEPGAENFKLVETPVAPLADGQVLVRHHFLSLDPYMRGRMSDAKSYAAPQPLDAVMIGGTAGEVVESKNPHFKAGDKVVGMGGWQEYAVVDFGQRTAAPNQAEGPSGAASDASVGQSSPQRGVLQKVDTTHIPLSAYLGAVGMPGVTGWYGLVKIIDPKAGETVVVSSAAGAVGGAVGQLAKARGARVVGIAGGPDKCRSVKEELGFDECIDYRQFPDVKSMSGALKAACPKGIDGYFENVGGHLLDAVMLRANAFARVAMCGMIAGYNGDPIPMTMPQLILVNRMKIEGFIVSEHMEAWPEALKELGTLVATGKLKYRETVAQGIASAPEAFFGLLKGRNQGKQLVRLV